MTEPERKVLEEVSRLAGELSEAAVRDLAARVASLTTVPSVADESPLLVAVALSAAAACSGNRASGIPDTVADAPADVAADVPADTPSDPIADVPADTPADLVAHDLAPGFEPAAGLANGPGGG